MKITIFILLLGLCGFKPNSPSCVKLDIYVLGDFSYSVSGYEEFVFSAFEDFVKSTEVSEDGIRIGIIGFNTFAQEFSSLEGNKDKLLKNISKVKNITAGGSTNLLNAMELAFEQLTSSRLEAKKMIIIISDGDVTNGISVAKYAENLKNLNVIICSILISDSSSRPELMETISSDCYLESRYKDLSEKIKQIDLCV